MHEHDKDLDNVVANVRLKTDQQDKYHYVHLDVLCPGCDPGCDRLLSSAATKIIDYMKNNADGEDPRKKQGQKYKFWRVPTSFSLKDFKQWLHDNLDGIEICITIIIDNYNDPPTTVKVPINKVKFEEELKKQEEKKKKYLKLRGGIDDELKVLEKKTNKYLERSDEIDDELKVLRKEMKRYIERDEIDKKFKELKKKMKECCEERDTIDKKLNLEKAKKEDLIEVRDKIDKELKILEKKRKYILNYIDNVD